MEGESDAYARALGGIRQSKSGFLKSAKRKDKKRKRNKEKKSKRKDEDETGSTTTTASDDSGKKSKKRSKQKRTENETTPNLVRHNGTGRLVSSGTTVYGQETKFMDQLANGDVVIVKHPTSLAEEIRVVTMILSNTSMSLSSAFSSDLVTPTQFEYMNKPKIAQDPEKVRKKEMQHKTEQEKAAYGTYGSTFGGKGATITYRKRKQGMNASGGYTIVKKQLQPGEEMTRQELLDLRCKQKSDRMCM